MKSSLVRVWLPGTSDPVVAGEFTLENGVGRFVYATTYLQNPDRVALDPVQLPLKRSTLRQSGVFGVFRDSGPDSWGRSMLTRQHGALDDLDCLKLAGEDGVGALTLSEALPHDYPGLHEIELAARAIEQYGADMDDPVQRAMAPTTSLGGAKPKLTISYTDGLWIAKFPERGDHRFIANNEHSMLKLARLCGIQTPRTEVYQLQDGRFILLSKRFDREWIPEEGGFGRLLYGSAHTVLGLTGNEQVDAASKSYLTLADRMRRWVGRAQPEELKRLWQRIAFNGLVGNGDDHARNHGLLHTPQGWRLSPAFDIVAFPYKGHLPLALRFHSKGAVFSEAAVLETAQIFGLDPEESQEELIRMAKTVEEHWEELLHGSGADQAYIDYLRPAFAAAHAITARHKKGLTP